MTIYLIHLVLLYTVHKYPQPINTGKGFNSCSRYTYNVIYCVYMHNRNIHIIIRVYVNTYVTYKIIWGWGSSLIKTSIKFNQDFCAVNTATIIIIGDRRRCNRLPSPTFYISIKLTVLQPLISYLYNIIPVKGSIKIIWRL